jgi:hypothetical protein
MINIKANRQYTVNLSKMLRNRRFLGANKTFGRNGKGRGNTEEHKEKKTLP